MARWTRRLGRRRIARRFTGWIWRLVDRSADASSRHAALSRYLYYEVSELRTIVRHLAASDTSGVPLQAQTRAAFDYQWRELNEGAALHSSAEFRAGAPDLACRLSGRRREWFSGRRVLDVGCGSGRFSAAFASMGAEVVAMDQSPTALDLVQRACVGLPGTVTTVRHDILEPFALGTFDLVWAFGVLHHTGDTHSAFRNVAAAVKPGGHLFLMLYGEPDVGRIGELRQQAEYSRLRRLARNKSYEEIIRIIESERPAEDVHGWFDAISPPINDKYSFPEVEGWLLAEGFVDIRKTADSANHHVLARRGQEPAASSSSDG